MRQTETKVICDYCGGEPGPPYYALSVALRSAIEPQINRDLDFCSWDHARKWFEKNDGSQP